VLTGQVIGGRTLIDAAAYCKLKDGITLKIKAENLFDKAYVAARRPYGLRPGKPREIFAGLALDF
jgi:Fe(3+) dicitrate transport protein